VIAIIKGAPTPPVARAELMSRTWRSPLVEENGEPTKDIGRAVDPSFFDVFEHRFVEGTKPLS